MQKYKRTSHNLDRNSSQIKNDDRVGWVAIVFIGLAFINFLVGASFGGLMAINPMLRTVLAPLHGEINPFGWLTMLIYGMTYAMLAIGVGLQSLKPWASILHVLLAEAGVVMISVSFLTNNNLLLSLGLLGQAIAPILFLRNILYVLLHPGQKPSKTKFSDAKPKGALALLQPEPRFQATDRIAQRGSKISLMLFILAALWMLFHDLVLKPSSSLHMGPHVALFLVYYGWLAGTVFSISLHLFPRLTNNSEMSAKAANGAQMIWFLAILISSFGFFDRHYMVRIGSDLLGVAFIAFALFYLWIFAKRRTLTDFMIPRASQIAFYFSFSACFILGVSLLLGLPPLTILALHLLFLAFITTLIYGLGYLLMPQLLHRMNISATQAIVQVLSAIFGVLLMATAFLMKQGSFPLDPVILLLGIGGSLAAMSALFFLLQWLITKPEF